MMSGSSRPFVRCCCCFEALRPVCSAVIALADPDRWVVWAGRTVLATIRNIVIHEYLRPEHEYVLWLDADVVRYPADLVKRLYETNPTGVSAPLVVIEGSDEEW